MIRRTAALVIVVAPALALAAACSSDPEPGAATGSQTGVATDGADPTRADPTGGDPAADASAPGESSPSSVAVSDLEGELLVLAAQSLSDVFEEIATSLEETNPDLTITYSFGSSAALANQIVEGAPADVAAFASASTMQTVVDAGLAAQEPQTFARNELVIVTKPGNPAGVESVDDLTDIGVVSLCGEEVPCGVFAQEVLDNAGVTIPEASITRGEDVRVTLGAVSQGDAEAGIVYVTDALIAGDDVDVVEIPDDINAIATYPAAPLTPAGNPTAAAAFVEYLLGDQAQSLLGSYGFLPSG
jgi:molybdate transport system substrate-binding protein